MKTVTINRLKYVVRGETTTETYLSSDYPESREQGARMRAAGVVALLQLSEPGRFGTRNAHRLVGGKVVFLP